MDNVPPIRFEWLREIEGRPIRWLIKRWLPAAGLAMLYGASGAGKSFVVVQLALAVASGRSILGARTRKTGVLIVAAEAPEGLRQRITAARDVAELQDIDVPLAMIEYTPKLVTSQDSIRRLIDAIARERLEFERRGAHLGLIIIDTLARSMAGGEENNSKDVGIAPEALERLARSSNALVLVVHHSGKDLQKGSRGHSSLPAACDTILEVNFVGDLSHRSLAITKQKEEQGALECEFSLSRVALGLDEDGEDVATCVATFGEPQSRVISVPVKSLRRTSREPPPGEKLFLAAFKEAVAIGSPCPEELRELGAKTWATIDDIKAKARMGAFYDGSNKKADEAFNKRFQRTRESLVGAGKLNQHEQWLYTVGNLQRF